MPAITRILVPVDLSERAIVALEYAWFVATTHNARVDILSVWEAPRWGARPIPGETRETMTRYLEGLAHDDLAGFMETITIPEGLEVETHLVSGRPAGVILDFSQENDCDLIIVATAARTGVSRVLVGSVAENLIRNAHCPVTTLRVTDSAGISA